MLGSVSESSKKNGSYIFTFKHYKNKDYKFKMFGVRKYGTAAKAKAAAEKYRKKLQPELKKLSNIRTGTSYVDDLYENNKAFRDFIKEYAKNTKQPEYKNFYKLLGNQKIRLETSFKKNLKLPRVEGYNTTVDQLAKKLDLTTKRLQAIGKNERLGKYINTNFDSIKQSIPGKIGAVKMFKDPTDTQVKDYFKNFKSDQNAIPQKLLDRIKNIDNVFRETVVTNKTLPSVIDVISKVDSINTPSEAAVAMAHYAKILRGTGLQQGLDIKENIAAGEKLLSNFSKSDR